MGKGTANNVIFANHEMNKVKPSKPIKAYSIPPNCYIAIEDWTRNANKLYAYCESMDVDGGESQTHLTLCEGDQYREITDHELEKFLTEKAERLPGVKLHHL